MEINLNLVKEFVKELPKVSKTILSFYNSDYSVTIKSDNTPVTTADITSDKMIREILSKLTPEIAVISEEGKIPDYEDRKNINQFWIVDPLDGTKDFINKTNEFAINIALIENRKPIVGILCLPVYNIIYFTLKNEKIYTYKDGKFEVLNNSLPLALRAVTSRAHKDEEAKEFLQKIEEKNGISFEQHVLGSSHKQIVITKNLADIYIKISSGAMEWDFAAGQILIENSGGAVIDLKTGESPIYNKENLAMQNFVMLSSNFLKNYKI